jgi:hypothetical protein
MRPTRVRWIALLSITVLSITSCAAFRQDKLPPLGTWPPAGGRKQSVRVAVNGQVYSDGKPLEGMSMVLDLWSNRVMEMYTESKLFSTVELGRGTADRIVEVDIRQNLDENLGLAVLTGLTLTLIPSVSHNEFKVRTTVRDADGNTLGEVEKSEEVNTWIQLFMVFPMITNFPTPVVFGTIEDLIRANIIEAHQRGWY